MLTMRSRLNLLQKALEKGIQIQTESGWLDMVDGEPGFLFNKIDGWKCEQGIRLIGQDTAWMALIAKARCMTEEELLELGFTIGMYEAKNV